MIYIYITYFQHVIFNRIDRQIECVLVLETITKNKKKSKNKRKQKLNIFYRFKMFA